MKENKRAKEIVDILSTMPTTTIEYLAKKLYVSESSIRRDIALLEKQGIVHRSYGGVSLTIHDNFIVPFQTRLNSNVEAKKIMAKKAIDLVRDGDVIFLDASTSGMYLAYELVKKQGLTIITNSILITSYFMNYSSIKVVCTGGQLDPEDRSCLMGGAALETLRNMSANLFFFSPHALSYDGELTDCYGEQVAVMQQMMKRSKTKVCLCTADRIGKYSTYTQCFLSDIDFLICEKPIHELYKEKYPNLKYL